VLSGDQLMFQSMKCEPPDTPPERSAAGSNMGNPGNPNSPSAGVLMTGGREYKVPEASNNWKAEVKVIQKEKDKVEKREGKRGSEGCKPREGGKGRIILF
jgi:hypothetical protein